MSKHPGSRLPYYEHWNIESKIMQEEKLKEKYDDGQVWRHIQLTPIYKWGYKMGDESAQNLKPMERRKYEIYENEDDYSRNIAKTNLLEEDKKLSELRAKGYGKRKDAPDDVPGENIGADLDTGFIEVDEDDEGEPSHKKIVLGANEPMGIPPVSGQPPREQHQPLEVEHPVPGNNEELHRAAQEKVAWEIGKALAETLNNAFMEVDEEEMPPKYKINNVEQKVVGADVGGLVGGVSMQLGPPRSFINLKRYPINSQVIIRNFHLLGHNGKSSEFVSGWQKRSTSGIVDTSNPVKFKNEICDPYTHSRRIAASAISLDLPAMCLDSRAKQMLNGMPVTRLKFLGGKIAFHGMRYKENQVAPAQRLTYTGSGTDMNAVERKIMWKMLERERDYPWMYDVTASGVLSTASTRDTQVLTATSAFDFTS